jgi:hypothetical protein
LEIIANSSIISLDKTKFLEVLKKAKYRKVDVDLFHWTINDPTLCPVAEENAENLQ